MTMTKFSRINKQREEITMRVLEDMEKEDRICLDLIHLKGQLTQARCNPEYLMSKWFLTVKKTSHPAPESDNR